MLHRPIWSHIRLNANFLTLFLLACLAATSARADDSRPTARVVPGEKFAFLVGVRNYDKNELRNLPFPEEDVASLAAVLKESGYRKENVVVLTQTRGAERARSLPTAKNIRREFKALLRDREEGDTILVALSGHGVQFKDDDQNYFCPMDAKLNDRDTLVALGDMYADLEKCPANVKLMLVDACRNDPRSDFSRARDTVKLESVTRPQEKLPPGGLIAFFSCSAGERAFEHDDLKQGVFFHYVVEGLRGKADFERDGVVDVDELVTYTKRRVSSFVRAEYGLRQMPEVAGRVRGLMPLINLDPSKANIERARELISARKYAEAVAPLDEVLRLNPRNTDALLLRAEANRNRYRFDESRRDLDQLLWIDRQHVAGLVQSARLYLERGRFADAEREGDRAVQANPESADAVAHRGWARTALHKMEEALADADAALRIDPEHMIARCVRSLWFSEKEDRKRSIEEAGIAMEQHPDEWLPYARRGGEYLNTGQTDEALADAEKVLAFDNSNHDGWVIRAFALAVKGDLKGALNDAAIAEKLNPESVYPHQVTALVRAAEQDIDGAIKAYSRAIELAPHIAQSYANRGDAQYALSSFEEAVADYTAAIRIDPRNANVYATRSLALAELSRYEESLADASRAIEIAPEDADGWSARAYTHYYREDYDKAIDDARRAIRINPKNPTGWLYRAFTYGAQQEYALAIADYNQVLELQPQDARTLNFRGEAHLNLEKIDEALADFYAAIKVNPKFAAAYINRANVWGKKDKLSWAVHDVTKAIEVDPTNYVAWNDRAYYHNKLKNYRQAVSDATESIRLNPENSVPWSNRAEAYQGLGDFTRAASDQAKYEQLKNAGN